MLLPFESLSHLPDLMLSIRALLSHSPLPAETVVILQHEEISQSQTVQQCAGTTVKFPAAISYEKLFSYRVPKRLFTGYLMEL
jgi:hypothetical protein